MQRLTQRENNRFPVVFPSYLLVLIFCFGITRHKVNAIEKQKNASASKCQKKCH